ncbi:glycosyltransferase family 4 protein [Dyadobacter pollutisoli]|jgi:glycosyltransferase involved in cell wall biosynthesis|uniref:Glycosyltransferase family 4 protein n=1 Tax=Dyadobacter pollutisoli TaxID=2910158 RepID=A0A9E8SPH5_9BACT|nr:glycosyltransferase family 4 protein [Dyadobacter pollutisoli]WAC11912.1 glycosyltransferase family 4 protein [Dyadobacter pollutisoli]
MTNKKILLLAHCGEDFYKARIPFAKFLTENGYKVYVVVPEDNYTQIIRNEGLEVLTSRLERDNVNPVDLLKAIWNVRKFIQHNGIALTHSFKFVPNLINVFSNLFSGKKVVLHIAGLGIAFANNSLKYTIIRNIFRLLFFLQFIRADLVIIQNPDDYDDFLFKRKFRNKIKVVKGSGVNTTKFSPTEMPQRESKTRKLTFLCTTRLIWEKGIREMVEAFESLPASLTHNIQLNIIGEPDNKNPRTVSREYIDRYHSSNLIHFLGRQDNIQEFLQKSDIFILPSYYREGIPRSILEALSCGLPVITTNVPGCNLTVISGKNGLIIEPRSATEIASAIRNMLSRQNDWPEMGEFSRKLAIREFSENKIFSEIVKLYDL